MSQLRQALERKRDIWSDEIFDVFRGMEDCASTGFDDGFDKCLELLWPCVEALEMGAFHHNACPWLNGKECCCAKAKVDIALKELKGKVGL